MKLNKFIIIVCFCIFISIVGGIIIGQKSDSSISDLYTLMLEEGEVYKLTVKNKQEEVIFQEQYVGEPRVETIYDDTLLIVRGRGDWHVYTFINIETGLVSEGFSDISAWNHEKVVYATFEDEIIKIIVQAIYDRNVYCMEIVRDFSPEAVPYRIILRAELLESQLMLEYYSGENRKVVKEMVDL